LRSAIELNRFKIDQDISKKGERKENVREATFRKKMKKIVPLVGRVWALSRKSTALSNCDASTKKVIIAN
jgi:hypothetical protein